MTKKILVIAAHADDEVLGCGGTISKLAKQGADIHIMFLADGVFSRDKEKSILQHDHKTRQLSAKKACNILGVNKVSFEEYPDNKMETIPLLSIVKSIEKIISIHQPEIVFTHHNGDLNIDHQITNRAVMTACRPTPQHSVKQILFFEVLSSTEWQIPGTFPVFLPNWYVDISSELDCKIKALKAYKNELHPWPHPRSVRGVLYLSRYRGTSVSVEAAEGFILGRNLT